MINKYEYFKFLMRIILNIEVKRMNACFWDSFKEEPS